MTRAILLSVWLCLFLSVQVESETTAVGQPSAERAASEEIKVMVDSLKGEIESTLRSANAVSSPPGTSVRLSAKSYRSQLVNGVNYFVKVKVTVGKSKPFYYHVKMYKSFTGNKAQFVGMTGPKVRKEGVQYF